MSDTPQAPPPGDDRDRGGPPPPGSGPTPPGSPPPSGGPPPPAPQVPSPGAGIGQPADLGTRVIARLIDAVLLWAVNAAIAFTLIFGAMFSAASTGFADLGLMGSGFSAVGFVVGLVTAILYVGYFALMESARGQTIGKMLMKIEVRAPGGGRPSLEQALKRNAWLALAIVPALGGLLQLAAAIAIIVTINNNTTTRQGWHDEFAGGTSVVRTG